MLIGSLGLIAVAGLLAALIGGLGSAVVLSFVVNSSASIGRMAFDSIVQRDAPDANQGRAFAQFETPLPAVRGCSPGVLPVLFTLPGQVGFLVVGLIGVFGIVVYRRRRAGRARRARRCRRRSAARARRTVQSGGDPPAPGAHADAKLDRGRAAPAAEAGRQAPLSWSVDATARGGRSTGRARRARPGWAARRAGEQAAEPGLADAVDDAGDERLAALDLLVGEVQAEQALDEHVVGRHLDPPAADGLGDAQRVATDDPDGARSRPGSRRSRRPPRWRRRAAGRSAACSGDCTAPRSTAGIAEQLLHRLHRVAAARCRASVSRSATADGSGWNAPTWRRTSAA